MQRVRFGENKKYLRHIFSSRATVCYKTQVLRSNQAIFVKQAIYCNRGITGLSYLYSFNQGNPYYTRKKTMSEAALGAPEDALPKLERQLTSTFDRVMEVEYDIDDLEIDKSLKVKSVADQSSQSIITNHGQSKACLGLPGTTSTEPRLTLKTGEATDIGGGHENQDQSMCFKAGANKEHLVMGVFDGHGRDLGRTAAIVARDYMKEELEKNTVLEALENDPKSVFEALFDMAHLKIKEAFKEKIEGVDDWEVIESEHGYLIKRQKIETKQRNGRNSYYQCFEANVHGGTTATVVVILNSTRILVANVGDSTALFGGLDSEGNALFKELSAEHSPESMAEFKRVKTENKGNNSPLEQDMMTLRFVYDVIDQSPVPTPKYSCPQIFSVDHSTGALLKSGGGGTYYKNVRSEWATLVTTPPSAKFQDALAFTRSLGDLHLHVYGVTHVPEVKEFNLQKLHDKTDGGLGKEASGNSNKCSVLLVCTDGVWDNWRYEDLVKATLLNSLVAQTAEKDSSDAQLLTDELMHQNLALAKKYFGSQADNMTGVVCLVQSSIN